MSITVRFASAGDEAAIVALIQELAAQAGDVSPVTPAFVTEYLSTPSSRVLLAELGGQVVGVLACTLRPNLYHAATTALIEELVVAAQHRGNGAGRLLVSTLLQQLEAEGCAEVAVTTSPTNAGAQRLYRALGLNEEALYLEKHF